MTGTGTRVDDHTRQLLELDSVLESLQSRCMSHSGMRMCRELVPTGDAEVLRGRLDRVAEYRILLAEGEEASALRFPDFGEALETIKVEGSRLDGEELVAIGLFLRSLSHLRRTLEENDRAPLLHEDLAVAEIPDSLVERILYLFDETGRVREDRVPELRRIRERIRVIQDEIQKRARAYFHDSRYEQIFSSDAPAYREGRTVLPIKSDFKGRVKGIVHDVSGTGQTVFVEPFEIVEQNNERAGLEAEYRNVIHRILLELTAETREHRDTIAEAERVLGVFDTFRARARYSLDFDCDRPDVGTRIRLRRARHPLLRASEVVPVDIVLEPPTRSLIITGPNTGGKTVALKTAGLLTLMFQIGMEIPVSTGSELPIVSSVLCDIGDEQSLEQSLSTFSGHMRNISHMLEYADEHSLLLLDELGSGTDPHEGGALGMAILDEIAGLGCHALVTTHHGALKRYGYTHATVSNASMEFDESSLAPTYRLLVGVPGSSHALSIAQRSGLPSEVLERARAYMTDGTSDTAEVLRALEQSQAQLEAERSELRQREQEFRARRQNLEDREAMLAKRREEIKEGKLRELDRFASQARSKLENLVREIREGNADSATTREVKRYIAELDAGIERIREGGREDDPEGAGEDGSTSDAGGGDVENEAGRNADLRGTRKPHGKSHGARRGEKPATIREGGAVRLKRYGTRATAEHRNRDGKWIVAAGSVRMTVSEEDLEPVEASGGSGPQRSRQVSTSVPDSHVPFELDVRGNRLAEALDRVERQIDDCLASGRSSFTVLHGKGTGALQRGVHDLLSQRREVLSHDFSRPEEGGTGKTLVTLDV